MPTKTMCALVAMLFCIPAIAADKEPLTPEQKKLARDVRGVLGVYCGKCHGKGGAFNGDMLIDHNSLLKEEFVVPGKPNGSILYTIIAEGDMPPRKELAKLPGGKFPAEKLKVIENWIKAGAPNWGRRGPPLDPPITQQDMTLRMLTDLKKQNPRSQRFIRYFTLTHLMNAGEEKDAMHNYRTALSKLVNSLSKEGEIIRPAPIDTQNDIFRINLRKYGWNETIWDKITLNEFYRYPYIIDRNPGDRELRKLTLATIPHIRADWFIAHGAKPELYHEILKLPETVRALEKILEVDVDENIRDGVDDLIFQRAGFLRSGVSKFNRMVERHKISRSGGGYWKSYDFSSNINRQNIFRHPLGPSGVKDQMGKDFFDEAQVFKHAGGEIIFSLANGLQGYFLADPKGNRIDKAPLEIVQNLAGGPGNDPVISNGISCITCHTRGMQAFDWKAEQLSQTINLADKPKVAENYDKQAALKLLSTAEEINKMVEKDTNRFLDAMEETADYENTYFAVRGGVVGSEEPIALLTAHYEGGLDLTSAAGELGVRADELEKKIKLVDELQEFGLQALLVEADPGVSRESWEENYTEIYRYVTEPYEIIPIKFPLVLDAIVEPKPLPRNFGRPAVESVAWSHDPDQKRSSLFSLGYIQNKGLLLKWDAINWQPRPDKPPVPFDQQARYSSRMVFSPVDNTSLAMSNQGILQILNIARPNNPANELLEKVHAFAWSPDGSKIAVSSVGEVKVLNAITGKELSNQVVAGKLKSPNALDWSPDGKHLAIVITEPAFNTRHLVEVWDIEFKKKKATFLHLGPTIDWGPKKAIVRADDPFSSRIAFGNTGGLVTIIEVGIEDGDENKKGDLQELVFDVEKKSVRAHKPRITGNPRIDNAGRANVRVNDVVWSADGERLASCSSAGDIVVWDPETLKVIQTIEIEPTFGPAVVLGGKEEKPPRDTTVRSIVWRSDRRMIAAAINDGTVRVFKDIK